MLPSPHRPDDNAFLHYGDFNHGRLPTGALAFLATLLWRRHRWSMIALASMAVFGLGLYSLEPLLLRDLVEALRLAPTGAAAVEAATRPLVLVIAVWLASSVFNRLRDVAEIHVAPQIRLETQSLLFSYLLAHSPQYFQENFAGRLAQKVKQAGQATTPLLQILFNDIVRLIVSVVIGLVMLATLPALFTWLLLGWVIGFLALTALLSRRCQTLSREYSEEVSASTGVLVDIVTNAEIVRAFARGPHECWRMGTALAGECRANMKMRWFLTMMWLVLYTGVIAFQATFLFIAVQETAQGRMSLGETVMIFSLATILGANVWAICARMLELFEQFGVLSSALDSILQPHAVADRPGARSLEVTQGAIRFEDIHFRHPDGARIFDGLSLDIQPGEKIGLVGPSGAGKSTLVRLLRRHSDLDGGRILIDGQDIAAVTVESLNLAIAEVPQDPSLFHRSIEANIGYADPTAGEAIQLAAQNAHCHDFIQRRAGAYAAIVGERGVRLSGGERQRIAIARAFLKQSRILILDEATSALDSQTEALIQDALWKLFEGRTVIAIAHRLSTVSRMDRILYLEQGRIVEQGTHETLLALSGAYAKLWQRQVNGFIE